MTKLPKEKRDHLILIGLITAVVLAALWFLLISGQKKNLRALVTKKQAAEKRLTDAEGAIKRAGEIKSELSAASQELAKWEDLMAGRDHYLWMVNMIQQFKTSYKIDIPHFSPTVESPVDMLPRFPYRQVRLTISGSGHYHDVGKFVADLENKFPHLRVRNVELDPVGGGGERLTFKMEIVALLKSGA